MRSVSGSLYQSRPSTMQTMRKAPSVPSGYRHVPISYSRVAARTGYRRASASANETSTTVTTRYLKAHELSSDSFRPFGQVITATDDGKQFDHEDAQLQGYDAGTPRFYVMRLPERGLTFHRITYHAKVTQCLGSLATSPWYIVVARPSGSVASYPKEQDMMAFRIPPGKGIKLNKGTWHAGPLFGGLKHMDFYNLELSDTNIVDHNTHDFKRDNNMQFTVQDDA